MEFVCSIVSSSSKKNEVRMANHCMLDLETLATSTDAVVVSVGAVVFDPNTRSAPGETFYRVLAMDEQVEYGRVISPETAIWWMNQSPEARAVFDAPRDDADYTLEDFGAYLRRNSVEAMWGNGSDFDNIIWGSLYETFHVKRPWSYSQNRCFRTMKNLALPKEFIKPTRSGTHHNALDDAVYQALYLQEIVQALKLRV
jgi:exodeoxyribonuclease VIII